MYQGNVESDKRVNLLFDDLTRHYHVIGNLTGPMAKRYVSEGVTKAVDIACYILANIHVATVWYVLIVITRGLEFLVTCATDTL